MVRDVVFLDSVKPAIKDEMKSEKVEIVENDIIIVKTISGSSEGKEVQENDSEEEENQSTSEDSEYKTSEETESEPIKRNIKKYNLKEDIRSEIEFLKGKKTCFILFMLSNELHQHHYCILEW